MRYIIIDPDEGIFLGTRKDEEMGGMGMIEQHIEAQINYLMRSEYVRNWWQMNATRTFSNVFVAEVNRITDT